MKKCENCLHPTTEHTDMFHEAKLDELAYHSCCHFIFCPAGSLCIFFYDLFHSQISVKHYSGICGRSPVLSMCYYCFSDGEEVENYFDHFKTWHSIIRIVEDAPFFILSLVFIAVHGAHFAPLLSIFSSLLAAANWSFNMWLETISVELQTEISVKKPEQECLKLQSNLSNASQTTTMSRTESYSVNDLPHSDRSELIRFLRDRKELDLLLMEFPEEVRAAGRTVMRGVNPEGAAHCTAFVRTLLNHVDERRTGAHDLVRVSPLNKSYARTLSNNSSGADVIMRSPSGGASQRFDKTLTAPVVEEEDSEISALSTDYVFSQSSIINISRESLHRTRSGFSTAGITAAV